MSQDAEAGLNETAGSLNRDVLPKLIPGFFGIILIWLARAEPAIDYGGALREVLATLGTGSAVVVSISLLVFVLAIGSVLEVAGSVVLFFVRRLILSRLHDVLQKLLKGPPPLRHGLIVPWYQRVWERLVRSEKQFLRMQLEARQVFTESRKTLPLLAAETSIQGSLVAVFLAVCVVWAWQRAFGIASALSAAPWSLLIMLAGLTTVCTLGAWFATTRWVDMTIAYLEVARTEFHSAVPPASRPREEACGGDGLDRNSGDSE